MYQLFFPGKRWKAFVGDLCNKLKTESVLITGLPQVGLTSFFKFLEETYTKRTKDEKTIIISFEILPGQTKVFHLSSKILELLNYKLGFPKYLQDLNCEGSLCEILKRDKKILILINRFQELRNSPQSMLFLRTLRSINLIKIRFLIGCDISCLTQPDSYKAAGILTTANKMVLPTLDLEEIKRSVKSYKQLYNWNVPQKFCEQILNLSGGICGLVKYIGKNILENNNQLLKVEQLLQDPAIKYKVTEICEALEKNELIKDDKLDLTKSQILKNLGVIDKNKKLRIKLLEQYLKKGYKKSESKDLNKILSAQEVKIFQLFTSHPDTILSLDEISEQLWGGNTSLKYSLWSIYRVISNLNRKLKKVGLKIKNYRGRGYSLTQEE